MRAQWYPIVSGLHGNEKDLDSAILGGSTQTIGNERTKLSISCNLCANGRNAFPNQRVAYCDRSMDCEMKVGRVGRSSTRITNRDIVGMTDDLNFE